MALDLVLNQCDLLFQKDTYDWSVCFVGLGESTLNWRNGFKRQLRSKGIFCTGGSHDARAPKKRI